MTLEFLHATFDNSRSGAAPVIDDLSLRQPVGTSIGIMGRRGSGKSVLIQLAAGSIRCTTGRVLHKGRVSMPVGSPATLHQKFTGEEITRITANYFSLDPDKLCRFVAEVSELGSAFYKPLSLYNGARRSRLNFSLSYAIPADCYLADGTLFSGDGTFRDTCLELAKQRKSQAAFFFTTNSPRDLRLFADVSGILRNGKIHLHPTISETIREFETTN